MSKSLRAILLLTGDPLCLPNEGKSGGGGKDALGKGRVAPPYLGSLCSARDAAESLNKQSRKEQSTGLQPWVKEELQRENFDM